MTEIVVEPVVAEEQAEVPTEEVSTEVVELPPTAQEVPEVPTQKGRAKRAAAPKKPKAKAKSTALPSMSEPSPVPEPEEPPFIPTFDQHLQLWYNAQRAREASERQARYAAFRIV